MIAPTTNQVDWESHRQRILLDSTVVYLNSGAAGPLPRSVFDRVTELRRRQAEEPTDFLLRRIPTLLGPARERLAAYAGCDPRRLVLTTNVTAAVNLVASSMVLEAPGEILMTDHEYPPMRWCWERTAARLGLTVRTFPLPAAPEEPTEIVEALVAAIRPETRLLFFSHVISATGMVLPARELCEVAAMGGIVTVIDGAHGPAFTELDLSRVRCDYYAASGHKWLLAPTGTGFLYCGPGLLERLQPMQVSWGHRLVADSRSDMPDQSGRSAWLRALEVEGTRDLCPWLALPEVVELQLGIGPERIRTRMRALAAHLRAKLTGWRGLELVTPRHAALSGGMTAFALPVGTDAPTLVAALWERWRIEAALVERSGRTLLRLSTHFFNTECDVNRLVDALGQLLKSKT